MRPGSPGATQGPPGAQQYKLGCCADSSSSPRRPNSQPLDSERLQVASGWLVRPAPGVRHLLWGHLSGSAVGFSWEPPVTTGLFPVPPASPARPGKHQWCLRGRQRACARPPSTEDAEQTAATRGMDQTQVSLQEPMSECQGRAQATVRRPRPHARHREGMGGTSANLSSSGITPEGEGEGEGEGERQKEIGREREREGGRDFSPFPGGSLVQPRLKTIAFREMGPRRKVK